MGNGKWGSKWGGAKKMHQHTIECTLHNQFWRLQKVGLVPSSEGDVSEVGGGSKTVFWEGFYGMFFTSPEFSTP